MNAVVDAVTTTRRWVRNHQTVIGRAVTPLEVGAYVDNQFLLNPVNKQFVVEAALSLVEQPRPSNRANLGVGLP